MFDADDLAADMILPVYDSSELVADTVTVFDAEESDPFVQISAHDHVPVLFVMFGSDSVHVFDEPDPYVAPDSVYFECVSAVFVTVAVSYTVWLLFDDPDEYRSDAV